MAAGGDVNAVDARRRAECHRFTLADQARPEDAVLTMALLIGANTDLHSLDDAGNTPLHFAVWSGFKECVALLLKAGATQMRGTGLVKRRFIGPEMLAPLQCSSVQTST